jgi:hypothetical protein
VLISGDVPRGLNRRALRLVNGGNPLILCRPLPLRVSELLDFTPQEWAVLDDGGMETFDLPPDRVAEAFAVKAMYPKLSANDCFCLVTTRCNRDSILLTGDGVLRRIATADGRRVHGALWVIDELRRLALCSDEVLVNAMVSWQNDPTVFLPDAEIVHRLNTIKLL